MRKIFVFGLVAVFFTACEKPLDEVNDQGMLKSAVKCTTIQSGQLIDSKGLPISTGYDEWGYNYQAKIFNGFYDNNTRPSVVVTEGNMLQMKWNDAWLSNEDCDGDGKLDRHLGFPSYIGSGAWLTNHEWGTYEDGEGNICEWDYFVKIVAVPADAVIEDGVWYNSEGVEIGPDIWGQFAIIQEVSNDPCGGVEGVQYKSPDHAGLGNW